MPIVATGSTSPNLTKDMTTEKLAPRVSYTPPKLRHKTVHHLFVDHLGEYVEIPASQIEDFEGRGFTFRVARPDGGNASVTLKFWEVIKP